jgi:hypothetical protein
MPFQVAFLSGGKFVIEQHHLGAAFRHGGGDLISLAAAGEKPRVGLCAPALDQAGEFQPGGFRQALEFLRAFCVIRGIEIEGDEQRALATRGTFKQNKLPSGSKTLLLRRCPAN